MKLAPIIIFCYNRPDHLKQTIEALQKNDLAEASDVYVFSDGGKTVSDCEKVKETRAYLKSITGFKSIQISESPVNKGLANSVISGVTSIFEEYPSVIVLEDDLVTSKSFITNMNRMLNVYKDNAKVFSLSGYTFPIDSLADCTSDTFALHRISSWGWATWSDRWDSVDWELSDFECFIRNKEAREIFNKGGMDLSPMLLNQVTGRIDSWAVRFAYSCYKHSQVCIYPTVSMVQNIGNDGSGTHVKRTRTVPLIELSTYLFPLEMEVHLEDKIIRDFVNLKKQSLFRRTKNYFKRIAYLKNIKL